MDRVLFKSNTTDIIMSAFVNLFATVQVRKGGHSMHRLLIFPKISRYPKGMPGPCVDLSLNVH